MSFPCFDSIARFNGLVEDYFTFIQGEGYPEEPTAQESGSGQGKKKIIWEREPEPPTITGIIFHLGFSSIKEFDEYMQEGVFAREACRAHLRVQVAYEKKLHGPSATGAIFFLKSSGWNEKASETPAEAGNVKNLTIELFESGPKLAGDENKVVL